MAKAGSVLLNSTMAYCTNCKNAELARIIASDQGVFMERMCPVTGVQSTKIAADHRWYTDRMRNPQTIARAENRQTSRLGCPQDCGPCQWHSGNLHLPVFSITNDCNLNCPKCFTYNRPDKKYYKSPEDVRRITDHILARSGGVQLINLTGGEPTLHPHLLEIINVCRRSGIGRITINTNGLRIAQDPDLAFQLKEADVQLVLSLDTLDPERSKMIHGRDVTSLKLAALDMLERLDIPTTILSVCIKEVNEEDVAAITQNYLPRPFVRSVTIQNMTYTGKYGTEFQPHQHITIDEVEQLLSRNNSTFRQKDFFPLSSYHPLCYSVAYYILSGQRLLSLTDLLDRTLLSEMSYDRYLLEPSENIAGQFRDGINRLWAEDGDKEYFGSLRELADRIFPSNTLLSPEQRRLLLEPIIKTVYIHPHMDADNFDIDRVSRCGDLVPDEEGVMIPACSYNLLYRQKDPRFWVGQS